MRVEVSSPPELRDTVRVVVILGDVEPYVVYFTTDEWQRIQANIADIVAAVLKDRSRGQIKKVA